MPYPQPAAERVHAATDGRHHESAQTAPELSANLWQDMALATKNAVPSEEVNALLGLVTLSDGKGAFGLTMRSSAEECQPEYITYNDEKGGINTARRALGHCRCVCAAGQSFC
jgi:hypothetical protein